MLFSSDDQAFPQGEEECEEEIGYQDQGGADGEGAKDKPRGFAAEEPRGWMDSTMASLEDEGDQCITVGQMCPLGRLRSGSKCRGPLWRQWWTLAPVIVLDTEVCA